MQLPDDPGPHLPRRRARDHGHYARWQTDAVFAEMQRPTRARADWENQTRFLAIDLLACARCAATCPRRVGEVVGWYLVTKDSYDRYRKPVMHTETNLDEHQDSVAWL